MSSSSLPPQKSIGERLRACVVSGHLTHAEAVALSSIIGSYILVHDTPKHAQYIRDGLKGMSKHHGVDIIAELRMMYHSASQAIKSDSQHPFPHHGIKTTNNL